MKKLFPYIILFLIASAVILLLFSGDEENKQQFDNRITFRKRDKIPYGTWAAFENLKHIFPRATVSINKKEPGYWDSLTTSDSSQALIIISDRFYADEFEMDRLLKFVSNGNDVFVSALDMTDEAKDVLKCVTTNHYPGRIYTGETGNWGQFAVSLLKPPFPSNERFTYPGLQFENHFYKIDTGLSTVIGQNHAGYDNFIHLKAGRGNFYVHLSPLAFTNYFLLYRGNRSYYENALSVISPEVTKIAWDEYYLDKKFENEDGKENKSSWFNALMGYRGLKWALLTGMLTLLIYVLFEMRRKQRFIPILPKTKNDSMDFVKTIGRLYFDKADHKNISRKMASYFLEHVRNKYKLPTGTLDETFVKNLQYKTGYEGPELMEIVAFIRNLEGRRVISSSQLADFHRQLEMFYKGGAR